MNKNRKLIRRENLDKIAELIGDEKLNEIKAYAEKAMLDVPDEAWCAGADMESSFVDGLFDWLKTIDGAEFWYCISRHFTVAPLDRLAQINAEIAALEAERRALTGK